MNAGAANILRVLKVNDVGYTGLRGRNRQISDSDPVLYGINC